MEEIIGVLNDIVWSDALIVLCLGTGLYFSIRTRFFRYVILRKCFVCCLTVKFRIWVSSFQALSMSLAGRVGTGNIAGVATAIAFGGPGAILDVDGCFFWSKYFCRSYFSSNL
jgi:AGCS family alanine or glycine:cation symporter